MQAFLPLALIICAQLAWALVLPQHGTGDGSANQTLLIAVGGYSWVGPCDNVEIYSLSDYMWNYGAEAPDMRDAFASVLLDDTIYVLGGFDGFTGEVCDTFWAYDIVKDQWTSDLPKIPTITTGSVAVALNGRIFMLGGERGKNALISEVYAYSTSTQNWDTIATPIPEPAAYPCATVQQNHLFYISPKNLFRSEDEAKTWQKLAPSQGSRDETACVAVGTDAILLIGGNDGGEAVDTVELYNITTNERKRVASMNTARRGPSAAQIPGTAQVMVCGGDNDSQTTEDSCEVYDWEKNSWNSADYSMQLPRVYFGLFTSQAKV